MANTSLGGFRYKYMRNGASKPRVEVMRVASAYGTGIFRGDPVKLVDDGTIAVAAITDAVIIGVADGAVQYKGSDGLMKSGNFLPASTTFNGGLGGPEVSLVRVILTRGAVFEIDIDEGTTVTTVAGAYDTIGENCDHIVGTGSTSTGRSAAVLDISGNSTNTFQWRIVGLSTDPSNDLTASRAKYLVEVNESTDPEYTTTGV